MSRRARDSVITVSGKVFLVATNTLLLPSVIALSPNLAGVTLQGTVTSNGGSKLAALSDLYQYYRFKKVTLRIIRGGGTDQTAVLGYEPDNTVTLPTTFGTVIDSPWTGHIVHLNANDNAIPSVTPEDVIPQKMLMDQNVRWWRTQASGGVDDQFEYQGSLAFASNLSAASISVELSYTVEFKNFISASLTPAPRRDPLPAPTPARSCDDDCGWEEAQPVARVCKVSSSRQARPR